MVKKPCIIIQARMNSNRLPGKVMKTIEGKPLIEILINRLKKSEIPILLATSTNKENDVLVEFAEKKGVDVFRGSEENVLERYFKAAKRNNCDIIIRVTGDNPLMDGELVKEAFEHYLTYQNERAFLSIGSSKTYPLGISASIFSFLLLKDAYKNATLPGELEHVTPYMINNKSNNIEIISYKGNMNKYHYRLTVDTYDDFRLHKILIEKYGCETLGVNDIVDILDKHSELVKINHGIKQKKWDE